MEYVKLELDKFIDNYNNIKIIDVSNFNDLYDNYIIKSSYDLKKEITENLIILPSEKHGLYLDYVESRIINETNYLNIMIQMNKWIDEFKVTKIVFPYEENVELQKILNTWNDEPGLNKSEQAKVIQIQSDFFNHAFKLQAIEIIEYIEKLASNCEDKIKWIGKPSQLGFIIGKLADLGYIDTPKKVNGDVNYTQLSKLVYNSFDVDTTEATLSKYLNLDSEKGQETVRNFDKNGFNIPQVKIVS